MLELKIFEHNSKSQNSFFHFFVDDLFHNTFSTDSKSAYNSAQTNFEGPTKELFDIFEVEFGTAQKPK